MTISMTRRPTSALAATFSATACSGTAMTWLPPRRPTTAAGATVDELLQDSQYTDDGVTLTQFPYNQMNRYVSKVTSAYRRYCEIYGS